MTSMSSDDPSLQDGSDIPSSEDFFIQASVLVVVDYLEKTGKEPATLEEEIGWHPALYREQSLAEWIRCEEKEVEECLGVVSAVVTLKKAGPPPGDREADPVYLTKDAGTPLYGSRPAEGYQPNVTSFVHESSEESLDAFGQMRRLLHMVVQRLTSGDPAQRTLEEGQALVNTLKSYLDVAKQFFRVN